MTFYCLDQNKQLRIFEVKDGKPELVKVAIENKGFKIIKFETEEE